MQGLPLLKGNIRRWGTWSQDCDNRKMKIFNNSLNKYKMRDSSSIYQVSRAEPRNLFFNTEGMCALMPGGTLSGT